MDENFVTCVDCGNKLKEDVALVVQHEPKAYKCIDCYVKILGKKEHSNLDTFVKRYSGELKVIRIDHFYSTDHDITARFIETTICLEAMIQVLACLQFKFEELVDETLPMDERHIAKLLERFFEVKDVTDEYQKYHSQMQLNENDWDITNKFTVRKKNGTIEDIIQIDLYEARESCCGPRYKELMDTVLPNTSEFENDIKSHEFYINFFK